MISLLLMTYNRKGAVARCLRSLIPAIDRPDVETLILDNASSDGTGSYVHRLTENAKASGRNIRCWLSATNRGVAGGRNFLMERARGELFILLDSDVVALDPSWLDQLIKPLDNPAIGLAGPGGHWVTVKPNGDWRWFAPVGANYIGEVDVVAGYCQAFRRQVWDDGLRLDDYYNPYWIEDSAHCLAIKERYGQSIWSDATVPLLHIYAGSGDDGRAHEKFAYFAKTFKDKGLVAVERKSR